MNRINKLFYLFFFISGGTALVYEIIWARKLALTFGSTVYAITTVLTAFMAGLSIGSYVFGKFAEKRKSPLLIYSLLEIGIGIYALLTPILLEATDHLYLLYYHKLGQQYQLLFFVRFLHSFIILLIPTIFMGGTLPVISKYLISKFSKFGRTLSLLYSLNTFGATAGTIFVGFYAMHNLGIKFSNNLAAILNLLIGAVSIVIWFTVRKSVIPEESGSIITENSKAVEETNIAIDDRINPRQAILYIKFLLFFSGYAAMAYEILWTRVLELFINSTTYSFTIILVIFLAGIALGSLLKSLVIKGRWSRLYYLALLQLIIGVYAFVGFPLFTYIPRFVLVVWKWAPNSFFINDIAKVVSAAIIMLVPTICMGMTFPIAAEIYSAYRKKISEDIGTAYAFNTWGNIMGSFITGIFMIYLFGIQNNMKLCVVLNVLLATTGFLLFRERSRKVIYSLVTVSLVMLLVVPFYPAWSPYILDSGVFMYQKKYADSPLFKELARDWQIVYYKEGLNALITVRNGGTYIEMRTNGKTDASSTFWDMHAFLMAGYLPLMLKPDAQNVMVIGLGGGATTGALLQSPAIKALDCVEIEESVIEAAKYFSYYNKKYYEDKRVTFYVEDGKSFLKSATKRYDLISSQVSNAWIAGIGNLYTAETYELMKSRLSEGGILLQWFQTYKVSTEIMKMVIRTFQSVFPYVQIWADGSNLYLIGSDKPIQKWNQAFFDLVETNPTVQSDFKNYFGMIDGRIITSYFIAENERARVFAGAGEINTDDKPLLEFLLPKVYYYENLEVWNWELLLRYREKEDWLNNNFVIQNPDYMYFLIATALDHQGYSREALPYIEKGLNINPENADLLSLKAYLIGAKNPPAAAELFSKALTLEPDNSMINYNYGIFLMDKVSANASLPYFEKARRQGMSSKLFWINYSIAFSRDQKYQQAVEVLKYGVNYSEDFKYKYYEYMGDMFLNMGSIEEARLHYINASYENPYYSLPYAKLGELHLALKQFDKAEENFLQALDKEPSQYLFYLNLATAQIKLNKKQEALNAIRKAYLLARGADKMEVYKTASALALPFP